MTPSSTRLVQSSLGVASVIYIRALHELYDTQRFSGDVSSYEARLIEGESELPRRREVLYLLALVSAQAGAYVSTLTVHKQIVPHRVFRYCGIPLPWTTKSWRRRV
ncbi:hypothetical protein NDU88_001903 [Pleurodeles waltl]|uniref:Uncharacterized protein n=1 Tax=Pleurodeles waltl TaxID=8319 RepID=A0AAV7W1N4_PLEWA|nr:hypothetical protein NDU88_001903 [Pleurodeles waltl]